MSQQYDRSPAIIVALAKKPPTRSPTDGDKRVALNVFGQLGHDKLPPTRVTATSWLKANNGAAQQWKSRFPNGQYYTKPPQSPGASYHEISIPLDKSYRGRANDGMGGPNTSTLRGRDKSIGSLNKAVTNFESALSHQSNTSARSNTTGRHNTSARPNTSPRFNTTAVTEATAAEEVEASGSVRRRAVFKPDTLSKLRQYNRTDNGLSVSVNTAPYVKKPKTQSTCHGGNQRTNKGPKNYKE